jgi:hypothetical protein
MSLLRKAIIAIVLIQFLAFLYVNHYINLNKFNARNESYHSLRIFKTYKSLPTNEWVLNFNVSLYSSIMTEEQRDLIQTEHLAFINRPLENLSYLTKNLRCIFKWNNSGLEFVKPVEIFEINYKKMIRGPKSIWRIRCQLNRRLNKVAEIEALHVALLDYKYFNTYASQFKENLNEILIFQKPTLVKKWLPKKKGLAHCLHKVIKTIKKLNFK